MLELFSTVERSILILLSTVPRIFKASLLTQWAVLILPVHKVIRWRLASRRCVKASRGSFIIIGYTCSCYSFRFVVQKWYGEFPERTIAQSNIHSARGMSQLNSIIKTLNSNPAWCLDCITHINTTISHAKLVLES